MFISVKVLHKRLEKKINHQQQVATQRVTLVICHISFQLQEMNGVLRKLNFHQEQQ